jgi:hypothetical protein
MPLPILLAAMPLKDLFKPTPHILIIDKKSIIFRNYEIFKLKLSLVFPKHYKAFL